MRAALQICEYGDLIMIGCGLLILIGAFRDWDWIFGDVSTATYRLDKLDGIINIFGRKTGGIAAGAGAALMIVFGTVWAMLCLYEVIRPQS